MSLEALSAEHARRTWPKSALGAQDTPVVEMLFAAWQEKHGGPEPRIDDRLRAWLVDTDNGALAGKALVLHDWPKKQRALVHARCTQLGLAHDSRGPKKARVLAIQVPSTWRWEFTSGMPVPLETPSAARKAKRHTARSAQRDRVNARLANSSCDECGASGDTSALCVSVHWPDVLCEDCTTTVECSCSGEPHAVDAHKWESLEELF